MVELWVTDLKWVFLFLLKNYSGTVMWIHSTRTLLMSLSSEKCGNASCFLHELCMNIMKSHIALLLRIYVMLQIVNIQKPDLCHRKFRMFLFLLKFVALLYFTRPKSTNADSSNNSFSYKHRGFKIIYFPSHLIHTAS